MSAGNYLQAAKMWYKMHKIIKASYKYKYKYKQKYKYKYMMHKIIKASYKW